MTHKRFSFRTIPNVTILWGSWHWAVSGPIGPNLPVFPSFESRPNSRRVHFEIKRVVGGFCFRAIQKGGSHPSSSSLPSPLSVKNERTSGRIPPFPSRIESRCKRKWENAKNGNLWSRLSERCPPSWSRLTTGVDQRNFAITLLPYPFLSTYLSISFALSFSLSHTLFLYLYRFLFLVCSFCPVSRLPSLVLPYFVFAHRNYNSLSSFSIYIYIYLYI